jgi:hypothetical protein
MEDELGGFRRRQPWRYIDTSLADMWRYCRKPLKIWVRISGVLNSIPNEHIPKCMCRSVLLQHLPLRMSATIILFLLPSSDI